MAASNRSTFFNQNEAARLVTRYHQAIEDLNTRKHEVECQGVAALFQILPQMNRAIAAKDPSANLFKELVQKGFKNLVAAPSRQAGVLFEINAQLGQWGFTKLDEAKLAQALEMDAGQAKESTPSLAAK